VSLLSLSLLASLLSATPVAPERTVRVRILERLHPEEVLLEGPGRYVLVATGAALSVNGATVTQPFLLEEVDWRLQPRGQARRHYTGALSVRALHGELAVVLLLPLERYVAEVVAAETTPGTPEEALRAQAVVARSFVLSQGPRHADADACDLAHCQLLRGRGVQKAHRARARAAALATAGQVLVLSTGRVAEAPFHAACGGHTADPEEVLGSGVTGAAAVADSGCPAEPWGARVPLARFRAALAPVLAQERDGAAPGEDVGPLGLQLVTGKGGYVVRVVAPQTGRSARGDAVARALDRAMGWGAVRSGRFSFQLQGDTVQVHGEGLGHGLGLCQAGAAARAARGERYEAILHHYFPQASLR
jgi:stage II sporulation protein D